MIFQWLKNRRKKEDAERAKNTAQMMRDLERWREEYFAGIKFPIVILDSAGYLGVSSIEEYFFDAEIHTWGIAAGSRGIDSQGFVFDFQKLELDQWVPNRKLGSETVEGLKAKLAPHLHAPSHLERIDAVTEIPALMKLLTSA